MQIQGKQSIVLELGRITHAPGYAQEDEAEEVHGKKRGVQGIENSNTTVPEPRHMWADIDDADREVEIEGCGQECPAM